MNSIHVALSLLLSAGTCFGRGQVVFANKVGTVVDAPVFFAGIRDGPGPNYSAQLFLQGDGGSLTALTPTSTFLPRGTAGNALTADRYWESKLVDIPVQPGTDASFIVRAWLTSMGDFQNAVDSGSTWGQSDPFVIKVGGGTLPPANLTTLKSFNLYFDFPEPSTITLGVLGAAVLMIFGRLSSGQQR